VRADCRQVERGERLTREDVSRFLLLQTASRSVVLPISPNRRRNASASISRDDQHINPTTSDPAQHLRLLFLRAHAEGRRRLHGAAGEVFAEAMPRGIIPRASSTSWAACIPSCGSRIRDMFAA